MKRKISISLICFWVLALILGTMPVSASSTNFFPADMFSSADVCGQYFANASEAGTKYENVDGEDVMTLPFHNGFNYLYTTSPIPYDTFTVSFDFYLIISPESHFHEMGFLFGMTGSDRPFHSATLVSEAGSLRLRHYTLNEHTWYEYTEDTVFYDVYEDECWQTFTVEVTPDDVTVYLNDELLTTLTDTEGCVGERGCIGLRAGSKGGWKIKNLKLVEGLSTGDNPVSTDAPTNAPSADATEPSTQEPSADATEIPTQEPTVDTTETSKPTSSVDPQSSASNKDGEFPWGTVGIIVAVVLVGGAVLFVVIRKKT